MPVLLVISRTTVLLLSVVLSTGLHAQALAVAKLKPDESVVIAYISAGCFHYRVRFYEVRGGPAPTFGIVEHDTWEQGEEPRRGIDQTLGVAPLMQEEGIGLDAYLAYLRHGPVDGCTTRDFVTVGYYRKGGLIGEERFVDGSCSLHEFELKDGRIVPPPDDPRSFSYPSDFSKALFAEITPPWLIERRIVTRAARLPQRPSGSTPAPVAGRYTLLPVWIADLWPPNQKTIRQAVMLALLDQGLDSNEYYAEVEPQKETSSCEVHLWHETALKNRGDYRVKGDPTGKCRTLLYDTAHDKVISISGWR